MDMDEVTRLELGTKRAEQLIKSGAIIDRIRIAGANHGDGSAQLQKAIQRMLAADESDATFEPALALLRDETHEARNTLQREMLAKDTAPPAVSAAAAQRLPLDDPRSVPRAGRVERPDADEPDRDDALIMSEGEEREDSDA